MRLLLDENFPHDFAALLTEHEVHTIHSLGWSGVKNGELLRRAPSVCDVFVTLDRNLQYQQNVKALTIAILVVRAKSNRMQDLRSLTTLISELSNTVKAGEIGTVQVQNSII